MDNIRQVRDQIVIRLFALYVHSACGRIAKDIAARVIKCCFLPGSVDLIVGVTRKSSHALQRTRWRLCFL